MCSSPAVGQAIETVFPQALNPSNAQATKNQKGEDDLNIPGVMSASTQLAVTVIAK